MQVTSLKLIQEGQAVKLNKSYNLYECDCGKRHLITKKKYIHIIMAYSDGCVCRFINRKLQNIYKEEVQDITETKYKKLRSVWKEMIYCCTKTYHKRYYKYGQRGIQVSKVWQDFDTFYNWALNQSYQVGMTLLLKNTNGHFSPENSRFIKKSAARAISSAHCLDEDKVQEIKNYIDMGYDIKVIADKYDVGVGTIRKIRAGEIWNYVGETETNKN